MRSLCAPSPAGSFRKGCRWARCIRRLAQDRQLGQLRRQTPSREGLLLPVMAVTWRLTTARPKAVSTSAYCQSRGRPQTGRRPPQHRYFAGRPAVCISSLSQQVLSTCRLFCSRFLPHLVPASMLRNNTCCLAEQSATGPSTVSRCTAVKRACMRPSAGSARAKEGVQPRSKHLKLESAGFVDM